MFACLWSSTTQDQDGKTALHFAVEAKNRGMVQELLNNGANVAITTKDGKSPADLTKDEEILRVLTPGRRSFSSTSTAPLLAAA